MADTKKEHYVPRCYLKNFASAEEYINVFDKQKMQVRTNQRLLNVAMENHFYDLNLAELYKQASAEEQAQIQKELRELHCSDDFEKALEEIDQQQHIEKDFLSNLEGIYSTLLLSIIKKSHNGSEWVIENCYALSESEKELLSLFIAIQIIRTKSFRDTIGSMIEKFVQTMAYKSQMNEPDSLPKEDFEVTANKKFVKLQHANMLLNPEMALEFAKVISQHKWVIYVNKTDFPFYTSDNPVATIPHKFDKFISYGGLQSEGVEILFPLSTKLVLGMYDTKMHGSKLTDRKYIALNTPDFIEYINAAQVINSQRFIFSNVINFELAERICTEHPEYQLSTPRIEVM